MKVLIAEDDRATQRLLEKCVRRLGHDVICAGNGEEAWERFTSGDFHFVLTDWMMPGCDGLDLCRRIRGAIRPSYVYIIIITSTGGAENLIAGMSAGADDFIVKPVDERQLQVRMRAAERILNLQRELQEKNLQLEALNNRLRHLSRLDSLTQLGNRLSFDETILNFHQRAVRYGSPYALLLADIDHFKAYNDLHGHPAGDEVLRRMGAVVKKCLRASDAAFRYGGEEIVVLLAEQSVVEAAGIAERLRAAVSSLNLCCAEPEARTCITISCGVSACPVEAQPIPGWDVILEWADQALYRAKALGRNRVEVASASQPAPV